MAEETIVSWTPTNWITVVLMVALAFAIVGFVTKLVKNRKAA
jgi:hypothetical protein